MLLSVHSHVDHRMRSDFCDPNAILTTHVAISPVSSRFRVSRFGEVSAFRWHFCLCRQPRNCRVWSCAMAIMKYLCSVINGCPYRRLYRSSDSLSMWVYLRPHPAFIVCEWWCKYRHAGSEEVFSREPVSKLSIPFLFALFFVLTRR